MPRSSRNRTTAQYMESKGWFGPRRKRRTKLPYVCIECGIHLEVGREFFCLLGIAHNTYLCFNCADQLHAHQPSEIVEPDPWQRSDEKGVYLVGDSRDLLVNIADTEKNLELDGS